MILTRNEYALYEFMCKVFGLAFPNEQVLQAIVDLTNVKRYEYAREKRKGSSEKHTEIIPNDCDVSDVPYEDYLLPDAYNAWLKYKESLANLKQCLG